MAGCVWGFGEDAALRGNEEGGWRTGEEDERGRRRRR